MARRYREEATLPQWAQRLILRQRTELDKLHARRSPICEGIRLNIDVREIVQMSYIAGTADDWRCLWRNGCQTTITNGRNVVEHWRAYNERQAM